MNLKNTIRNAVITAIATAGIYAAVDLNGPKEYNITHYLNREGRLEQAVVERQYLFNGNDISNSRRYDECDLYSFRLPYKIDFNVNYDLEIPKKSQDATRLHDVNFKKTLKLQRGVEYYRYVDDSEKITSNNYLYPIDFNKSNLINWYAKQNNFKLKNLYGSKVSITKDNSKRYSLSSSLDNAIISYSKFKWDTIKASIERLEDIPKEKCFVRDSEFKDIGLIGINQTGYFIEGVKKNMDIDSLLTAYFGDFLIKESVKHVDTLKVTGAYFKVLKPSREKTLSVPYSKLNSRSQKFIREEYNAFLHSGIADSIKLNTKSIELNRALEQKHTQLEKEIVKKQKLDIKEHKIISKADSVDIVLEHILK